MLILSGLLLCVNIIKVYSISNSVIDISEREHHVDLDHVPSSGIVGVIHKATEGLYHEDPYFKSRRSRAEKLNLRFGAYHVAEEGHPLEQVEHFLNTVGDTNNTLLVLDLERNQSRSTMSPGEAERFVKRIKRRTGRYPLLFGSGDLLQRYRRHRLSKCGIWVASRTAARQPSMPRRSKSWVLWQYTDGVVGGAPRAVRGVGLCSRDRYAGPAHQLMEWWPDL